MNQGLSWGLLVTGGLLFLGMLGHDLQSHSTWSSVLSPQSTGEMLVHLSSAGVAVAGALGIKLKG